MDISFKTPAGRFNYRVSAVIIRNGCLLTMQDNAYSYSYLPGGRVKMGETSAEAMQRELQEELRAALPVIRPLWICEDFFTEEDTHERFHEICIYYLLELPGISGSDFSFIERGRRNSFEWIPFEELKDRYLYPEFIKERIWKLPESFEILTENSI